MPKLENTPENNKHKDDVYNIITKKNKNLKLSNMEINFIIGFLTGIAASFLVMYLFDFILKIILIFKK